MSILNKALGEGRLEVERDIIHLTPGPDLWVDVLQFEGELAACRSHGHAADAVCPDCLPHLREAVSLYRGDFMAGFTLRDSLAFDEWQHFQTEALRRELTEALERLVRGQSMQADFQTALPYARRWVALDPLHEPAHRQLMELYARAGQRAAALHQYQECVRLLQDELGVPPAVETTALAERIRLETAGQHVRLIKSYELRQLIGAGGFGEVYHAYQPLVRREVAIKVILPQYANQPDFIRRFEAEAQVVAQLEHPHIVPLYDYWREPDGAYLVMRWLRGGSLEDHLKQGYWEPEAAARLLDQISGALMLAHQRGIVHRDIKPANILLDELGNGYLSDFGIAKNITSATQTQSGLVVGSPAYMAPELINGEAVTPQADIYSLGVMLYQLLTGQHPFADTTPPRMIFRHLAEALPSLQTLRPELPAALDEVIQQATAKDPAQRFSDVLALAAAVRRSLNLEGTPPGKLDLSTPLLVPNPYKGLRAFQQGDAADFFGREQFVERLLAHMAESSTDPVVRFLAVIGPSGSGKSSVVKAGLIPALRREALPGSSRWYIVEMTPGPRPLEELEAVFLRIAVNPPPTLLEQLQADERGLLRAVNRILPDDETELLLLIDQFEELFTLVENEAERSHFLESLRLAVTDPRSQLRVVITLRADFYDQPLLYPAFGDLLCRRMVTILPLSGEELARAITGLAERVGASLEPGLAALMVAEVQSQPGLLPLLQYALTELFEQRQGRCLTHQAYQASGGVVGALAQRADALYTELDELGQAAVRRLFLRLVTLGEGTADTRRRVPRPELLSLGEGDIKNGGWSMEAIMDTFGQYRLLTFDRDPATRSPMVEVAHEALLTEWDRLRQWLAEDREFLLWQQRLRAALHQWQTSEQDEGALLRGAPLVEAENWFNQRRDELSQAEQAFIQAGLALRERRAAEQEAQRQRELEAAQKLAEAEHLRAEQQSQAATKLRKRAVWLAGALVIAGFLAVAAVIFGQRANQSEQQALAERATAEAEAHSRATAQANAETQQKEAERQARLATSRELAAAAVKNLEVDPELSILLALQAVTTTYAVDDLTLPEALDALHQALPASRVRLTLTGHTDPVYLGIFSPDGTLLATSDFSSVSKVWDAATGHELFTLPGGDAAFSLDDGGKRLVTVSAGQVTTITTWNVDSGEAVSTVPVQVDTEGKGFLLTPDWTRLTVWDTDGTGSAWDATTSAAQPEPLFRLVGHTDEVRDMAFSPDGTRWATASNDETARVWEASTGKLLFTLTGHTNGVEGVAFSPDGRYLATFGNAIARIWDTATGEERFNFIAGGSGDITFSPDGLHVATVQDTVIKVWDLTRVLQTNLPPALNSDVTDTIFNKDLWLEGHSNEILGVAFNSAGTRLLSASRDGTARVWDISPAGAKEWLTLAGHTGDWYLRDIEFSPDGSRLATASPDQTAKVWDAATGQELLTLAGHSGFIYEVTFSPDGTRLATASADHTAKIWDAATGQELFTLGHTDLVNDVAFSPDGARLATASDDHTVKIWDVLTGQELLTLAAFTDFVQSVAFSPDGTRLATGSGDKTAKIWDTLTGQEIFTLTGHTDTINDVAFSPDGTRLATASFDGSVKMWQAATDQELFTLTRDQYSIMEVAFSPDGTRLAAASGGRRVIVWDISGDLEAGTNTGQELLTLPSEGRTVAFSPDGRLLATGNDTDITGRVYILPVDELLPLARSRLTRTWTPEECWQYLHLEACPE